jgi:hypothetical protein
MQFLDCLELLIDVHCQEFLLIDNTICIFNTFLVLDLVLGLLVALILSFFILFVEFAFGNWFGLLFVLEIACFLLRLTIFSHFNEWKGEKAFIKILF